jgi:hypothetical protein
MKFENPFNKAPEQPEVNLPSQKTTDLPPASQTEHISKRVLEHDKHSRKTASKHGDSIERMPGHGSGWKKDAVAWGDQVDAQLQGEEDALEELERPDE